MRNRTIEWVQRRLHERLVGAKWYLSTEIRDGGLVARVTSVTAAHEYGPSVFYNCPVTYEQVPSDPAVRGTYSN